MRFVVKLSLIVLAALGAYLFWPRHSSLSGFEPSSMAKLQISVRRHTLSGKAVAAIGDEYRILDNEFQIPPLEAIQAALQIFQARRVFADAADNADEEQALPFLENAFSILSEKTSANLDPKIMARLELFTWALSRDGSKQRQLAAALSEQLALLHGGASADYQAVAADFARARKLAAQKNWTAAEEAETTAWEKLRRQLDNNASSDQRATRPSTGSSRNSQL